MVHPPDDRMNPTNARSTPSPAARFLVRIMSLAMTADGPPMPLRQIPRRDTREPDRRPILVARRTTRGARFRTNDFPRARPEPERPGPANFTNELLHGTLEPEPPRSRRQRGPERPRRRNGTNEPAAAALSSACETNPSDGAPRIARTNSTRAKRTCALARRTRAGPPRPVAERARAAAPAQRYERTQPPRSLPPARRTRAMVRRESHERIPPVRNEPAHSHARTRAAPHRWQIEPERPPVQRHERTRRPCSLSHARRTRAMVSPASALPQSGCRPRAGTHRRHQLGS